MQGMNSRDAIKAAMRRSGVKQTDLAEKLGVLQSAVTGNINRQKIGLGVFVKMLNAIGYTVMVGEKHGEEFEPLWEIVNGDE